MALPPCQSEDGNSASFVGTFLNDGTAVALCDECLPPFFAAMLGAMTGVDMAAVMAEWQDNAEAIEFVAEVNDAADAAGEPEGRIAGNPVEAAERMIDEGSPVSDEPPGETPAEISAAA